jgi:alginate O-acetyltransferase complex protein AlgJ
MKPELSPPSQPKLGREEIAKIELGQTQISRDVRWFLTLGLLLSITIIPVWQHLRDLRQNLTVWEKTPVAERRWTQLLPQVYDIVRLMPDWEKIHKAQAWWGVSAFLPAADDIKLYEQAVEDNSVLAEKLLPRVQWLLTRFGGTGNEEAVTGRDGWLFYKPDIRYLTDPPFLNPVRLRNLERYTEIEPNPVPAILEFRDQLAKRGIALVVMPVPVKPQIYPARLAARFEDRELPLQNDSYSEWLQQLKVAGVLVFDPGPVLADFARDAPGTPAYLATDTHWSPEAMARVAEDLAGFLRGMNLLPPGDPSRFERRAELVSNQGDIAVMLRLPENQTLYRPQTVPIQRVYDKENKPWKPDVSAPVLLLGDSFVNIFSSPDLRWGENAGLAEQLAVDLGLPVDVIAINAGGSHTTREELVTQLRRHYAEFEAKGSVSQRERLADKQIVVYQFAARELLSGNWKRIDLPERNHAALGEVREGGTEQADATMRLVRGKIAAMSRPPRPGTVPYRDAVIAVHLVETEVMAGKVKLDSDEALVYMLGMADNRHTPAADLRVGSEITLALRPWSEMEGRYGSMQRLDVGSDADFLFPAWWGEPAGPEQHP